MTVIPIPEREEQPGRRLRLTPASAIRMRPVRWAWQDRMPAGHITLVPGREGIGKSLLLAWLTARVTRGELPGVHYGTPRPVFYAATEDSWAHTIAPRLLAAGADLAAVFRVEVVEADAMLAPLTLPRDCEVLTDEITRLGVAMLALDPLMSVIAAGIDTHRDRELRTALEPLARLADRTGCAVVGLAHFNKSASSDVSNLITGSRAFSSVTRSVVAVARDTDDDEGACVLSQAKNNLGRLDLPSLRYVIDTATVDTDEGPAHVGRLRFTGESARSVSDILSDGDSREDRSARDEAVDFLRTYLSDGAKRSRDVLRAADEAQVSRMTLKRARKSLGVVTEELATRKDGRGEWWMRLPGDEQVRGSGGHMPAIG